MNIDSLYNQCRQGDKIAENELFRHLSARFRLFAELKIRDKVDAEEVVQNAIMTVARKYPAIEFEVSFAAWAHKVLQNEILKYYRSQGYRGELFVSAEADAFPQSVWSPDPDLKRHLMDCMRKLCEANGRYARVLNLKYQGYEATEICRKLKVTADNFYVILSRARSMLKACLDNGDFR